MSDEASVTAPAAGSVQRCALCGAAAEVQWRRRADVGDIEAVFACGVHAITLAAAALVHAASCSAPNPGLLPGCDCTPEPHPADQAFAAPAVVSTSTGWAIPTATP